MGMPKGRKAADRTTAGSSGEKADTERARAMRAKTHKAELEIAALERSLLPFDEVVQAWQQLVAAFRARCLALPSKLSSRLAVINERKKAKTPSPPRSVRRFRSSHDSIWQAALRRVVRKAAQVASPPPELTVSQWADQNLRLSPEDSGEHGQYQSIRLNLRPIRYACIRPEW